MAVLPFEVGETFGDSGILRPETHVNLYKVYGGNVVILGVKVDTEDEHENGHYIDVGDSVNYNKYNVIEFQLDLEGLDEPVKLDVLSVEDIYWV